MQTYHIGDFVYLDVKNASPYQIYRIENFIQDKSGRTSIRLRQYFRRADLPKRVFAKDGHKLNDPAWEVYPIKTMQKLQDRELLSSNKLKVVYSPIFAGKCSVFEESAVDNLSCYQQNDDCFFYSHSYGYEKQTATYIFKEVRIGNEYQIDLDAISVSNESVEQDKETLMWDPNNPLTDDEIDCFTELVRDHLRTSFPSTSITNVAEIATGLLHESNYSIEKALSELLSHDLIYFKPDYWSASDEEKFLKGLRKEGRKFSNIQRKHFPNRPIGEVTGIYYQHRCQELLKNNNNLMENTEINEIQLESAILLESAINGENLICQNCHNTTFTHNVRVDTTLVTICRQCHLNWKKYGSLGILVVVDSDSSSNQDREESLTKNLKRKRLLEDENEPPLKRKPSQ